MQFKFVFAPCWRNRGYAVNVRGGDFPSFY